MSTRKKPRSAEPSGPQAGEVWLGPAPPITAPHTPALLTGIACGIFQELELAAALTDGVTWYPIHATHDVSHFEGAYGVLHPRWAYNGKCLERAQRSGEMVLGLHAGFHDLFAPIAGGPWLLVTGPFALGRPSAAEMLERWQNISGSQGRASNPEFLRYVEMTSDTTTFDRTSYASFERTISCLSSLLGPSPAPELGRELKQLRESMNEVRKLDRMWRTVRGMIDESTGREWEGPGMDRGLSLLGLKKYPEHVLVGLLVGLEGDADPIEDLLKRHAFQRRAAEYALKRKGLLVGRLGNEGIVLLRDSPSSGSRLRSDLAEIGDAQRRIAKQLGLKLHLGFCPVRAGTSLAARYESALATAEFALSNGKTAAHAEELPEARSGRTSELRRQLAAAIREKPSLLAPRFGRFFEAIASHSGHRLEPVRAQLEAAFDSVTDVFQGAGSLDDRSLSELTSKLAHSANAATTLEELHAAYRGAIADIEAAVLRPQLARSDQRVRRATAFVRDHSAEKLTVAKAARIAGLAPRYFAKLFLETEKVTFHQYLLQVRLERSKQMLLSSKLSVERVGELTGFPTRTHFHRAFKHAEGVSPQSYRVRKRGAEGASRLEGGYRKRPKTGRSKRR